MRRRVVRAVAHAKVNLDLRVLGTRPDGRHELRAVFQSIGLHDTITCTARRGPFSITCRAPGVPLDETNLVWRAAAMLWKALGFAGDVRDVAVRIDKRIPMQAGLGGGSSDAAAALVALGRLWAGRPPIASFATWALQLGADVAFFFSGGTALGLGTGEEIYPLVDLPRHWIVLVIPTFGVSTRRSVCAGTTRSAPSGYPQTRDLQVLPVPMAVARGADDQRPRAADRPPASGDRRDEGRRWAERGRGCRPRCRAAARPSSGCSAIAARRPPPCRVSAGPAGAVILTRTVDRAEYERRSRPGLPGWLATDYADHGPRITRITRISRILT